LRVLSLFDGMSCGQLALHRAGVRVDQYFASEIDKNSIKVTQTNFPNTVQLGSVVDLSEEVLDGLGKIDLLIGGSPCRNLSRSIQGDSKNLVNIEQGLKGDSALFFEFVRVLRYAKPKYFLFENVESMRDEDKDTISDLLGVEPIMIDSALVSAQSRKRYFWTNIEGVTQPEDKGLYLKDIVLPPHEVDSKFWYDKPFIYHGEDKNVVATLDLKNGFDMQKRVYGLHSKAPTLTACRGGNLQKKVFQDGRCRKLTPLEYERLQTVPEGYTAAVADSHRYNILGDGWTIDVISHILSFIK
jgi:site-specific DNA-cytosine methylase